uniref:Uncharacterized protein n=1 Tax=Tanacetum cinerariifolium TaxID=118510 RepID=A0A6L2LS37_TANCI|nr:hypothetical protein [Tanacetum cinerariifolium]
MFVILKNKEVISEESEEHQEIRVSDTDFWDVEVRGADEVSENASEELAKEMDDVVTNEATQELRNVSDKVKVTYAKMIGSKIIELDMCYVPNVVCENGSDVVIFDEELLNTSSAKWDLPACGYFVRMKMNSIDLRYNLMRMWGRYSLGKYLLPIMMSIASNSNMKMPMVPGVCWEVMEGRGGVVRNGGVRQKTGEVELQVVAGKTGEQCPFKLGGKRQGTCLGYLHHWSLWLERTITVNPCGL